MCFFANLKKICFDCGNSSTLWIMNKIIRNTTKCFQSYHGLKIVLASLHTALSVVASAVDTEVGSCAPISISTFAQLDC